MNTAGKDLKSGINDLKLKMDSNPVLIPVIKVLYL